MKAIRELTQMGYVFWVTGDKPRYKYTGNHLDKEQARPRLRFLLRHPEEALSFLRCIEAEAIAMLDQMDTIDQLEWCRQWAELAERAGWPCTDHPSWAAWLATVEAEQISRAKTGGTQ